MNDLKLRIAIASLEAIKACTNQLIKLLSEDDDRQESTPNVTAGAAGVCQYAPSDPDLE